MILINIPLSVCNTLNIPFHGKRMHTTTQSVKRLKDLKVPMPEFITTDTVQLVSTNNKGEYRIIHEKSN